MTEFVTQPHNTEAEEAVIGSVFIAPETFFEVSEHIVPEDFYVVRNQWVWEVVVEMMKNNHPIDAITVSEELEKNNRLGEVGGKAYLMSLVNQTPTSLHAEAYAKIVKSLSIKRQLLLAANEIGKCAYDEKVNAIDAVSTSMSSILKISGSVTEGKIRSAREVFTQVYDQVDELSQKPADEYPGVATGIYDLDKLLGGGLQKSKFYVLGGRPGQGKTSFLMTVLHNTSVVKNRRVAVFSLEMPNEEVGRRLVSIDSHIDGQIIKSGKLNDAQWAIFVNSYEKLAQAPIYFDDSPYLNPMQLRSKCKRLQAQYDIELVVVDYLGLMLPDRDLKNKVNEVSEISRSLKLLSRDINVPVLVAHQLNREVEKRAEKKPQLSDLRDSGSIEQDADAVLLIYRGDAQGNLTYLDVAKQREGPIGMVDMQFIPSNTRFVSVAKNGDTR